jgi:hypothetical protein
VDLDTALLRAHDELLNAKIGDTALVYVRRLKGGQPRWCVVPGGAAPYPEPETWELVYEMRRMSLSDVEA